MIAIDSQVGRKLIPRLIGGILTSGPVAGCRRLECTVLHNEHFQIGAVAEHDIAHRDKLLRQGDGRQICACCKCSIS